jgi:serine/threonine-protein kinase
VGRGVTAPPDVKPANLFLARRAAGDVVVKILDFGIAKIKPEAPGLTSGLTRSGSLLATPRYMSPEQAQASRTIDFRSDLWSLGMVLYHALSANPPHHRVQSLGELILAIATAPPRLVPELVPWVPQAMAALVHRALEIDPTQRFPSAAAMLDAIRQLLPDGWSLDESMLAPPAGAPGAALRLAKTVRARRSGPADTLAETEPEARGPDRTDPDAVGRDD